MSFLPLDLLRKGSDALGVPLNDRQCSQLDRFAQLLIEANRSLNLTRITDPRDIVVEHYLDSLACVAVRSVGAGSRCVDVGAGAGFPGIPAAVARPDLRVTLLDSSRKKLKFVEAAAAEIGLENVDCLHIRAEDAGRDPGLRESWDVAWTRALAAMRVLVELCLPLVRVGGFLAAYKSRLAGDEIREAEEDIERLGGKLGAVQTVRIPGSDIERLIALVDKVSPTPARFPRRFAQIRRELRQHPGHTEI